MAQAIVTVLILLIFVAYAVFFSLWNAGTIAVVGWNFWPQQAWAEVPMFVVPLAGVVIGAIVMAIAVSTPWSSLKSRLVAAENQLRTERSRLKECQAKVEALKDRLRQVQGKTEAAPRVSVEDEPAVSEEDA